MVKLTTVINTGAKLVKNSRDLKHLELQKMYESLFNKTHYIYDRNGKFWGGYHPELGSIKGLFRPDIRPLSEKPLNILS